MVSSTDFANSLTVDGASSAHYTLAVMSVVALDLPPARPPLPGLDVPRLPRARRRRRAAAGTRSPARPDRPSDRTGELTMAESNGRPRVADPRRRLRRHRRRARAPQERRRRGDRRRARLPHVPAAAVPGRDRPARAADGRPPAARPRATSRRTRRVHNDAGRRRSTSTAREVQLRRAGAARLRLPRARARRRGQLLRRRGRGGARVPALHAARRRAPQGPRARALGGGRPRPEPDRRRRAERRRRRRRPDRRRDAPARWPSSTAATSSRTTRDVPPEQARITLVEAGPELFSMFKPNLREYTSEGAREARASRC